MTKDETKELMYILKENLTEQDFERCCHLITELCYEKSRADIEDLLCSTFLN